MVASSALRSGPWATLPRWVVAREWCLCATTLGLLTAVVSLQGGLPGIDRALYETWRLVVVAPPWGDATEISLVPRTAALCSVLPVVLTLAALLFPIPGRAAVGALLLVTLAGSYEALHTVQLWFPPAAALLGIGLSLPCWRWRELRMISALLERQFAQLESEPPSFAESPLEPAVMSETGWSRRLAAAGRILSRIQELRSFTAQFVDDLNLPTLVTNLDGHVVLANRAARQYFAVLGNNQIDGAQLPYLLGTLTADTGALEFSWWDILDASEEMTRAAGHDAIGRDMLVCTSTWSTAAGERSGWVATLVDVTEIRNAERSRDAALHFMTGTLCAPSQSILILARDGSRGADPLELLRAIEGKARRTLELAEKFVQLSIATTHPYVLRIRPVHESVELAIDANEPFAEGRGARIVFEAPREQPLAELDPDLFWRAVHTLLQNALRFSPSGGEVRVLLTTAPTGGEMILKVSDQGRGITPSEQARLARMFQNIDLPGAPRGGNDLGLAFVKEVAERHGGRVDFTSNPGHGSEFRITLPYAPASPLAETEAGSAVRSTGAL